MLTEPADVNPVNPNVRDAWDEASPSDRVFNVASSYVVSRTLHMIVELGVADALGETPSNASDLAAAVGADTDALERMLRLLAGYGIFDRRAGAFAHSPASRLLRSDHPQSMRAAVQVLGSSLYWGSFASLMHTLRTGRPATEEAYPAGVWAYFAEHPADGSAFNTGMTTRSHAYAQAVVARYDFSGFARIGDIGGGHGHLLHAILGVAPEAQGIVFDLPSVIQKAPALSHERLTLQAGDFFRDPLPACDLYVVMEVIHNWPDAEAVAILQAIRRAASSESRVLIIERMLSDEPGPDRVQLLDVVMVALAGGRQRTGQQYAALLDQAGFALQREVRTRSDVTILEAVVR